tara:strand:+ start:219 stop:992 length:774 start_codon:yes stop_codon:yes gene_type:complete
MKLSHWYGRLGNNIQQCAIGTMVAQESGGTFKQELDHDIIEKYETTFGSSSEEQVSKFFYWEGPYREVTLSSGFITRSISQVCKEFVFPHLRVPRVSVPDDTIVIHIRSGDVFDKGVANPDQYVPNPLDFYRQLLDSFDKALVVTEPDEYNPVVEELKRHSKVTVQSLSVAEDFATLMGAKNVASSGVGTFAVAAALCSQRIERFYCTNVSISEHLNWHMLVGNEVEVHCMDLDNYIKPGEWRNTDEQRQFILDYKA